MIPTMPPKKTKKKKRARPHARQRDNKKIVYSLDLLNSKALLALKGYLDYPVDDAAHITMERLFQQHRQHKKEMKAAIINAFFYLTTDRYIPEPDDHPAYKIPKTPPPSTKVVKAAKKHINRIAKKVWKKK